MWNAAQIKSIAATRNLPNAATTNGKAWARTLPAMKVPPQNKATITNLRPRVEPSAGGSFEGRGEGTSGMEVVDVVMSVATKS